jgi:hypothetical protein
MKRALPLKFWVWVVGHWALTALILVLAWMLEGAGARVLFFALLLPALSLWMRVCLGYWWPRY